MKRLQWLNLVGVLALAALCIFQWQRDRALNLEINRLEKARQQQEQKLAEQDKAARALNDDLAHFKQQFQGAHTNLAQLRVTVRELEREKAQLHTERDQLKSSVTNWSRAVAERDARLGEANGQLRDLTARLNETVQKFNELATNHNRAMQRFNELGSNYNAVVGEVNRLRSVKAP